MGIVNELNQSVPETSSSLSAAGKWVTCPGPFVPPGPDPINPADWPRDFINRRS